MRSTSRVIDREKFHSLDATVFGLSGAVGSAPVVALVLNLSTLSVHAQAAAFRADSAKFGWTRTCNGLLSLSQAKYDKWAKAGNDAMAYELNFNGNALLEREHDSWETKGKENCRCW